jgi:two-component sensor histidine kinase
VRYTQGEDGQQAFMARLRALADAHDLLTTDNWGRAPIRHVVDRALRPFQTFGGNRLAVGGPEVWLNAQTSLMLTMCLHELATNAAKYGALSNGSGHVRVSWQPTDNDNRKIGLTWQETDGPAVAPPTRKGFGSVLIESSGIDANLEFHPKGLHCQLQFII